MERLYQDSETGCCKRFDPSPWDGKEIKWADKLFLKDHVRSILHIPLDFGKVMVRDMDKINAAGALAPEPLMLSDERSLWGADVYISVSKDVPEAQMTRISGTFLSKVFEGSYKDMSKFVKEMKGYVSSKGTAVKKMYFFYTTCPACAKVYGKNYVVILAEI